MKITIYSTPIAKKQEGIAALAKALEIASNIFKKADPNLLTPAIKDDLEARQLRLNLFLEQSQNELAGLIKAHEEAIRAGQYKELDPSKLNINK